jgi:hypothetical protein
LLSRTLFIEINQFHLFFDADSIKIYVFNGSYWIAFMLFLLIRRMSNARSGLEIDVI